MTQQRKDFWNQIIVLIIGMVLSGLITGFVSAGQYKEKISNLEKQSDKLCTEKVDKAVYEAQQKSIIERLDEQKENITEIKQMIKELK